MSAVSLRRISAQETSSTFPLSSQGKSKPETEASHKGNSRKCRMYCPCTRINSCCCYLLSGISNNVRWFAGRAFEIKIIEIPYFLIHPSLIVRLFYRQRVKDAIANLQATKVTTTLSKIEPSHPIEGNWYAEKKCRERVLKLHDQKSRFIILLKQEAPISQALVDDILKSTTPMECVFDEFSKKYITFNGTGRLFSLKVFFRDEFQKSDPKIEIDVYRVDPALLKGAIWQ